MLEARWLVVAAGFTSVEEGITRRCHREGEWYYTRELLSAGCVRRSMYVTYYGSRLYFGTRHTVTRVTHPSHLH